MVYDPPNDPKYQLPVVYKPVTGPYKKGQSGFEGRHHKKGWAPVRERYKRYAEMSAADIVELVLSKEPDPLTYHPSPHRVNRTRFQNLSAVDAAIVLHFFNIYHSKDGGAERERLFDRVEGKPGQHAADGAGEKTLSQLERNKVLEDEARSMIKAMKIKMGLNDPEPEKV
jgi:hypothetical protein